jgi:hypothetical protein
LRQRSSRLPPAVEPGADLGDATASPPGVHEIDVERHWNNTGEIGWCPAKLRSGFMTALMKRSSFRFI